MRDIKINITFDRFSFRNLAVKRIIKTCVEAVMVQQGVNIPCEINVLVTNDEVIREINHSTRSIDSATDVLSFPMFGFEPGVLPEVWDGYLDPERDVVLLVIWLFPWNELLRKQGNSVTALKER